MVIERHAMDGTPAETAKRLLALWRLPEEDLVSIVAAASMIPSVSGEIVDEDFEASWQAFLNSPPR